MGFGNQSTGHRLLLSIMVISLTCLCAASMCAADALLIHADGSAARADNVKAAIDATGLFTANIDLFDADVATPDPATLSQYDSVLIWSRATFGDPTTLGDNLADYVDSGGGVVVAMFANSDAPWEIGGRWKADGRYPILSGSYASPGSLQLGAAAQPDHPILNGVDSFSGGTKSWQSAAGINPQANLIASWSNGQPLVAEMTGFVGRVAALNFYPVSTDADATNGWAAATDGDILLANALQHVRCPAQAQEPTNPLPPQRPGASVWSDLFWNDPNACRALPNENITVEGNSDNVYPFSLLATFTFSMRYQQIYAAEAIGRAGTIKQIRFRPDGPTGHAFGPTDMGCQIYLGYAATSVTAPSETFADNIGAGRVKVFDGELTLASAGASPPDFDIVIDVDDLFFYDPAAGDLLLDIYMFNFANTASFDAVFVQDDSTTRIYSAQDANVNALTGIVNKNGPATGPYGLVTLFCFEAFDPCLQYDVYFGTTNPPTQLIRANRSLPNAPLPTPLDSCTPYYWQVIAKDCCGQIPGPVWTFTTAQRADLTTDNLVNYLDQSTLAAAWSAATCSAVNNWCDNADLNRDASVDVQDLLALAESWLGSCTF